MNSSKRVVVLLDTSGSIDPYKKDLVECTNATLQSLYITLCTTQNEKDQPEDVVYISIYTFNETLKLIMDGVKLDYSSPRIALEDVHCGGETALYDSIGSILCSDHPLSPGSVLMVVTDGADSCSGKYERKDIQELICVHRKPERNVRFVYVSVGYDAQEQGYELGFWPHESVKFDNPSQLKSPEGSTRIATQLSQSILDYDQHEDEPPCKQIKQENNQEEEELQVYSQDY